MSEPVEDYGKTSPLLPEWESFLLVYNVAPAFQYEYAVTLAYERGQLLLWTKNAPDLELLGQVTDKSETPGVVLPIEDAARIVDILQRARITPFVRGDLGCDGVTYELTLSHGLERVNLGWWLDLPKGWRGLQPLLDLLEGYATTYGQAPTPFIQENT